MNRIQPPPRYMRSKRRPRPAISNSRGLSALARPVGVGLPLRPLRRPPATRARPGRRAAGPAWSHRPGRNRVSASVISSGSACCPSSILNTAASSSAMRTNAPSPRRSLRIQRRDPSPSSSRFSAQPERTRGRKPNEVTVASVSLAPTAEISRLAPGRITIVRPASLSSRRRSTLNSTLPTWTRAPSRRRAREPTGRPSRNVPCVEPASSTQAPSPPARTRAWWRDTERSSS